MRACVVGGGLAGCAAALELVRGGHDVALLEARPTLGGAVQTLPEREGDPSPPPDNGQHIALGCFTEYLRFLAEIGEGASYRRQPLALPVIGEDGSKATIKPSLPALVGYAHLPLRDRLLVPVVTARCRTAKPRAGETFGALLRRLGASSAAVDRFWDVFIRPALNLRSDEVDAEAGLFTVRTALLGSDAHWVFDRGALTGNLPPRGQYLTVVSSGVPELMDIRGRELVDRIASQVTERLGDAELLWSRVSREPHATIALRPGVSSERRSRHTSRANVVRAGAWTQTGWPATMESAVRSGRAAARLLSNMTAKVAA